MSEIFCELFIGASSLSVRFVVFHGTIISYALFVLSCSSDFCAAYYYYYSALTQILHAHRNTYESVVSHRFPPPSAPQVPMVVLSIWHPLPPVPPSHPCTTQFFWSIHTIQTVASQFLPFYHPVHKKPIYQREPE